MSWLKNKSNLIQNRKTNEELKNQKLVWNIPNVYNANRFYLIKNLFVVFVMLILTNQKIRWIKNTWTVSDFFYETALANKKIKEI